MVSVRSSGLEQEKRERILGVARDAFSRFGYKKASIDEIAQGAGVAKGTVYLAAESKGDLYYQVLLRELRDWNAEVTRTIDPTSPADQQMVVAATRGIERLEERPLLRALFTLESDAVLPELKGRFDELRQVGLACSLEILQRGVRQGVFRPSLDLEEIAGLLLDIQTSTIIFHVRGQSITDPDLQRRLDRRGAAIMDVLMNGIRADAAPDPSPDS